MALTIVKKHPITIALCLSAGLSFLAFLACSFTHWDGGYLAAEFRFKFVTDEGRPIEAVRLSVERLNGAPAYYYPVNDYGPQDPIVGDSTGVVTFHHVSQGIEFSGKCSFLYPLVVLPNDTCKAPDYSLRFLVRGKELYRTSYRALNKEIAQLGDSAEKHIIAWKWPVEAPDRLPADRIQVRWEPWESAMEFPILRKTITLSSKPFHLSHNR